MLIDLGANVRKSAIKKGSKEEVWIGGDWRGEAGAVADNKILHATNGALVSLTAVLHRPVDLAAHIRTNPDLSTFASLLPESLLNYIATAPHLTLFAPTNEAWASLSDLELKYLKSGFAEKDLIEIFGAGASREGVGKGKVGYVSSLFGKNPTNTTTAMRTIWNSTLEIAMDESNYVAVNGTRVGTPDILALNGERSRMGFAQKT